MEHSAVLLTCIKEHSAVLLTCIKILNGYQAFVLSFFEWPLKTGLTAAPMILVRLVCANIILERLSIIKAICIR